MASESPVRRPSEDRGIDPVLDKVAKTNTFDSDWPTLQHHMALALTAAISSFLSAPSTSQPPATPTRPPVSSSAQSAVDSAPEIDAEATPPPLASPSSATSSSPTTPTLFSRFAPAGASPSSAQSDRVEGPSTPGGLVIPAFPPREKRQRGRGPLGAAGQKGGAGTLNSPTSPGPSITSVRVNGHSLMPVRTHPPDDDWDEDIVIGGKQLPGRLEEVEAKKEAERLVQMLEDFRDPPFTIQRLAELLSAPFSQHSSTGKYLRAIEKLLLVNTPWEVPSYVPVPANSFAVNQPVDTAASASTSDNASPAFIDIEASMPPRSVTPMFSPITFGRASSADPFSDDEEVKPSDALSNGAGANGAEREKQGEGSSGRVADRLMSPLTLGAARGDDVEMDGEAEENGRMGDGIRSPAPEPEDGSAEADDSAASEPKIEGPQADEAKRDGDAAMSVGEDKEGKEGRTSPYTDSPRPTASRSTHVEGSASTSAAASALVASTSTTTPATSANTVLEKSNDPAHQPYLGRVDELDTGPLPSPAAQEAEGRSSLSPESRAADRRSGNAAASAGPGEGTGEGGNMTPHGMSEKPMPISSTTEIAETDKDREVAGLPKRASVVNLKAAAEAATEGKDKGKEGNQPTGAQDTTDQAGQSAEDAGKLERETDKAEEPAAAGDDVGMEGDATKDDA